ncbi:hypothetical protein HanIR_Chr06g0266401 [Helianthus annuus]|nr:hypothetical protein HanIR_Chr06g0266401 [Helianthus annuus]
MSSNHLRALNMDRKYKGKAPRTTLTKVSLPPKERLDAFYALSLPLSLSKTGFQLTDLPILVTIGNPRKLKGKEAVSHLRIFTIKLTSNGPTPTSKTLLLRKLTFKPDAI